ncbi:MAG: T9SS type A sorting domain-containing protein [Saprospiraceae bacterium]|nr:T9SS type A sorting domain-containing protein [Saprospiraceae bacterium]
MGGLTVNDLSWSNDRILLAGDEAHTSDVQFRNTAAWMQSYDLDSQTFNSVMDAEMLEVIKTQQPVATLFIDIWQPYYSVTQGTFDVRVRNLSFATLDSLTIHTAYYGKDEVYIDCVPLSSRKSVMFTGLNLGPAEEVTLPIGLVESPYVPYNRINPWKVCMWVGNPNGQVDSDHSNNLSCVDVYPTVSTDEPDGGAFTLFPNPATDACTITWGENLRPEMVQVYDVYGRLLLTETVNTSSGTHDLQLATLPPGVYTVALEKVVQRLIKQ